jgi:aspartate kinase
LQEREKGKFEISEMAVALRFPGVARETPAALAFRAASTHGFVCASPARGEKCWRRGRGLAAARCQTGATTLKKEEAASAAQPATEFTVVMKFGGSSLASAERVREVADLVLSFPEETPVIVLSAMGKTTNNLLLVPAPFL